MKIYFIAGLFFVLIFSACGGVGEPNTADRIIGTWRGTLVNDDGDIFPTEWEFSEDGKLVLVISPGVLDMVQVADYWFDDDGAIRTKEITAAKDVKPGRRVIKFISDDVMTLTAEESGIVTTVKRVTE